MALSSRFSTNQHPAIVAVTAIYVYYRFDNAQIGLFTTCGIMAAKSIKHIAKTIGIVFGRYSGAATFAVIR